MHHAGPEANLQWLSVHDGKRIKDAAKAMLRRQAEHQRNRADSSDIAVYKALSQSRGENDYAIEASRKSEENSRSCEMTALQSDYAIEASRKSKENSRSYEMTATQCGRQNPAFAQRMTLTTISEPNLLYLPLPKQRDPQSSLLIPANVRNQNRGWNHFICKTGRPTTTRNF